MSHRKLSLEQVMPEPAAAGEGLVPMGAIPSSPSLAPADPIQFLELFAFYRTLTARISEDIEL